jgi:hypothetical protein
VSEHAPTSELPAVRSGEDVHTTDTDTGAAAGIDAPVSDAGGRDAGVAQDTVGTEQSGSSVVADGEVRDSASVAPEKTTAWSEEELTGGRETTDYEPPAPEQPKLPEWVTAFGPGETFSANGWECKTLHVGMEDGHWLVLMQPQRRLGTFVPKSRAASRAEFKGMVRTLGKKKAKKVIKERAAKAAAKADADA